MYLSSAHLEEELIWNVDNLANDILLLTCVLHSIQNQHIPAHFPHTAVLSCLERLDGCIEQHTAEIRLISSLIFRELSADIRKA